MSFLLFAAYLVACFLVGLLGRDTRLGFWVVFILSVIFTPLPVAIVLFLASPSAPRARS